MTRIKRLSPVAFAPQAAQRTTRNLWEIVQSYAGENPDFALVDLSHAAKWELQDNPATLETGHGLPVPTDPGQVVFAGDSAICRQTGTRVLVWNFGPDDQPRPRDGRFTEITDGQCLLFLSGDAWASVMQRICPLDLILPHDRPWAFWQGPVLDIPAKLLLCHPPNARPGLFIAVARGFGQSLAEALLKAGADLKLTPGGEAIFRGWWRRWLEMLAIDPQQPDAGKTIS